MRRLKISRVTAWVLALVAIFLLALALTATSLIWNAREAALLDSESQALRFASGAEAALNRSLLTIDVLLASVDEPLGLSGQMADWIDGKSTNQLLHYAANLNMMVRNVALVDAQGRVIASSGANGAKLAFNFPAGFVDEVLSEPVSALTVSAPVVSFASSERVLYFARHMKLADSSRILAVAEVPVASLTSVAVQGVDISELEVTIERSNGQLLASMPALDQLSGRQLASALGDQQGVAHPQRRAARLSGVPAIVVARPLLYRGLLIGASIPFSAALQDWRTQRDFIVSVALVFALMILACGGFAHWYLDRLATARLDTARAKTTMDQALESMVSGFLLLNADYQVLRWNRRFEEIFPWHAGTIKPLMSFRQMLETTAKYQLPGANEAERQEWIKLRLALQMSPQGPHQQNLPNGHCIQITEQRTPEGGMVIVYHDVTALQQASAEIENLAFYDPLTHLPNRRLLMDRLQQATAASARSGQCAAILFLDLDRFKTLNDTLGHAVGDLLLQQVAQRLRDCVREKDTVARLGGDEFVVLLEDLSEDRQQAAIMTQHICDKILEQLNQTYPLMGRHHLSTPSIGATLFNGMLQNPAELLKQADIAMYQVKARGRNAMCFFDPQMQTIISARADLEEDLRAALTLEQFELYYQPQVEFDGRVMGAEVLIRWHHPVRGMVPPLEFIAVAEESELILQIGQWVLLTACRQLARWQQHERGRALSLCVNVSARQFREHDFVARVMAALQEAGADPQLLKLELTESMVLDNVADAIGKMTALKSMGVSFSVDDFGTGHSSLTYLTRLPLDQIKIDQSFVRNIGVHSRDAIIVQTIIGMGRNLGLEVIAEGVETQSQQEFLFNNGCALYQGYLFGRPTPLAEFEALLG